MYSVVFPHRRRRWLQNPREASISDTWHRTNRYQSLWWVEPPAPKPRPWSTWRQEIERAERAKVGDTERRPAVGRINTPGQRTVPAFHLLLSALLPLRPPLRTARFSPDGRDGWLAYITTTTTTHFSIHPPLVQSIALLFASHHFTLSERLKMRSFSTAMDSWKSWPRYIR